jgi:hypothetical protein
MTESIRKGITMGSASRRYLLATALALTLMVAPPASARVDTGARTSYPPVERTVSAPAPVVTEASGDFDWFSAAVGAAIATGMALLVGATARVRRNSAGARVSA